MSYHSFSLGFPLKPPTTQLFSGTFFPVLLGASLKMVFPKKGSLIGSGSLNNEEFEPIQTLLDTTNVNVSTKRSQLERCTKPEKPQNGLAEAAAGGSGPVARGLPLPPHRRREFPIRRNQASDLLNPQDPSLGLRKEPAQTL